VLTADKDPGTGEPDGGSPHVLIIRRPGGKLTWLRALGSRRAAAITAILGFFTGFLITDGYTACQQMLPRLAGIQQCAAHVIRRCRAVTKLGPGSLQSWAGDVIEILREAHQATAEARARGEPAADAELLARSRPFIRRTCRRDHGSLCGDARIWRVGRGTGTVPATHAFPGGCGCTWYALRPGCRSCGLANPKLGEREVLAAILETGDPIPAIGLPTSGCLATTR
jgi:hypothetical protein